jgi:DNA-binding CsgD family transcriptional regulator
MSLINTQRFSELVGDIYDSAVDPTKWQSTFDVLSSELRLANCSFTLHVPPRGEFLLNIATGMSDADRLDQQQYELDIAALWGGAHETLNRPIDRPWIASRLFSQDYVMNNRFVREWAYPREIIDCVAVVVGRDPSLIGSVAMGRHRDHGLVDDETIANIQLFLPHLQRAARITGLLEANVEALRNFEAVIEAIISPVIIVRGDLSVVLSNTAAAEFFDCGELVAMVNGRLSSPVPGVQRVITRLIESIGEGESALPGNGMGLPVRTGFDQVHTLNVLPLARGNTRTSLASGAVAAIFISSTAIAHNLALDLLTPLFELTAAEIRVFELISAGRTTKEAAHLLGVAPSTIRTHLIRLFEKTGVNRQADLIRMAHSLASPTTPWQSRIV